MINADRVKEISDNIIKDVYDNANNPLELFEYLFGLSYTYHKLYLSAIVIGMFKGNNEAISDLMLDAATKDLTQEFINNLKKKMEEKNG